MPTIFPTLDFIKIEARYPKSVDKIEQWLFEQEELKNMEGQLTDGQDPAEAKRQFTGMLIQLDPRKLYEVFDALGIKISITYNSTTEMWTFFNSKDDYSYTANSRIEAEQTAFEDAFEELEKSL